MTRGLSRYTVGQMDKSPKQLHVPIDPEQHMAVKLAAVAAGWELSALVRRLLVLWLEGKVKVGKPPGRGKA